MTVKLEEMEALKETCQERDIIANKYSHVMTPIMPTENRTKQKKNVMSVSYFAQS